MGESVGPISQNCAIWQLRLAIRVFGSALVRRAAPAHPSCAFATAEDLQLGTSGSRLRPVPKSTLDCSRASSCNIFRGDQRDIPCHRDIECRDIEP